MPVLKHLDGNCHLYVAADVASWSAEDLQSRCVDLVVDAKTGYPGGGVCNAVEHVLIDEKAAQAAVPRRL